MVLELPILNYLEVLSIQMATEISAMSTPFRIVIVMIIHWQPPCQTRNHKVVGAEYDSLQAQFESH